MKGISWRWPTYKYRLGKVIGGLLVTVILASCGINEARTPEQWFDFTWSGLAGCDTLTFRGLAALQRGNGQGLEESFSYTGRLQEHKELSIRGEPVSQRGGHLAGHLQTAGLAQPNGWEAKLRLEHGNWQVQSDDHNVLLQGVVRLNPLEQLEEIRMAAKKKITSESGAARGTKVLRIEMDPAEATIRLKDRLLSEMELTREAGLAKLEQVSASQQEQLRDELSQIWTTGSKQLSVMLEQMKATVVYHLTIDRKSGLPSRLTSETTLNYLSPKGVPQREVLRTDNRFGGYQ
ncbi:hypothetical protein RW092_09205 [Paenibacillus sp. 3LSP]|uniref:hypothetical protein n=1 Tax=Paenibacillus sp. 3LSP TaxID=2800795 RepID=UPI0028FD2BC1|nr:hypothetical protein [Paenibacillus sp. 3LSP]MDU0330379.1 hypothetical protein [Paenibacillus sp. 3LSP]